MYRTICRVAVALILLGGCTQKGPSEICEGDNECEGDLSCLAVTTLNGSTCEEFSSICTQTCATDTDCDELGEGYRCFEGCDGVSSCGKAEVKTTDLPASAVCETTEACEAGLACLPVSAFNGAMCTEVGMACSITCETDTDCADLGAQFRCFDGCDGERVCGATG